MIVLLSQNYSITLILQGQRGFLLFLVVNHGGLLPICSGCKRIRDESGKWWPLDAYVKARTEAEFTHTICSDCKDVFYPDL
jgi:hypothetical protein